MIGVSEIFLYSHQLQSQVSYHQSALLSADYHYTVFFRPSLQHLSALCLIIHIGYCSGVLDIVPYVFRHQLFIMGDQGAIGATLDDDIAIIGFSLKFPGEATSAERFWEMLLAGRSAASDFPANRLNLKGHYHPDKSRLDQMPLRGGYFLEEEIDRFDAPFFSISPQEAACMEPQQRYMLETSYRALENGMFHIWMLRIPDPEHLLRVHALTVSWSSWNHHISVLRNPNLGSHRQLH